MDEEYFRNQADLMTWLRNPQRSTYFIFKDEERGWVFDIRFNVMNRENLLSDWVGLSRIYMKIYNIYNRRR